MDAVGGRSVFISYRRQLSWQLAKLVRANLTKHNIDVFVDLKNLDSGEFERTILSEIEARENFIVLLEPGCLDRIGEDGDWLRHEIAHALAYHRNVVPVTASGFRFSRDLVLPPDVAKLPSLNAVGIEPEYFEAAMKLLRSRRFLKMPPRAVTAARPSWRPARLPTSPGVPVIRSAPRLMPKAGNILSRVPRLEGPKLLPAPEAPTTPKTDDQIEREANAARASAAEAQAERETRAPDTSA